MLALGAAVGTAAALAGLVSALFLVPGQQARETLGSAVAVALALGTLLLLAGTLMLPGAAESPGAALRHLLDGLVIAAALWFVAWVLLALLGPARGPPSGLSVVLPSVVAAVAAGLTTVLAMHAYRPRMITVWVAAGVTSVAVSAVALAAAIRTGNAVILLVSAILLPAGLLVVARAVKVADHPVQVTGDVTQRGTAYAFVPMIAMIASASWFLAVGGQLTAAALAAVGLEGVALVTRQYLALVDVKKYTLALRQREAHFRELAHTDPLTGLANRRGLLRALREPGFTQPRVLIGIDLDGFKNVNDMRGHDVGDMVLAEVAERLRANLLWGDVAARLGGDEFAVLMAGSPDEAMLAAKRLLAVLGEPYEVGDDASVFLSASVGVAGSPAPGDTGALMRDTDLALRYAKQRGKNRVERYQKHYDELLRRHNVLESELRHAIDRDQLRLVYQPVVALPSMRIVGAEALLRWTHPELGVVAPIEFIPVAEESGLINRLGTWVLTTATRQLAEWLAAGHDIWCSVNLSPKELHAADYAGQVADVLDEHGVPPQRLVLEVTEHAVATDLEELINRLTELRATGVRIALDDFGAGYSSLGQLRNLPVDILKIDQALVREPQSRTGTAAPLVDVVVRLGHRLGLEVLAEGIGTTAQRAVVEEAGCRLGQGSLFGWGVPAEHLEAQLRTMRSPGARSTPAQRSQPPAISAGPARSQLVSLGPGMKQLRALLPTDPAFEPRPGDQDVGSVDSSARWGKVSRMCLSSRVLM